MQLKRQKQPKRN